MNKNFLFLIVMVVTSCSSTGIAGIDRPDYVLYEVSESKPKIDGKYIACTVKESPLDPESRSFYLDTYAPIPPYVVDFHVGNGKISEVNSTFGKAKPGEPDFAWYEYIDLIMENETSFVIGKSNRERLKSYGTMFGEKKCGVGIDGLLNITETIYSIIRSDGFFSVTTYVASSTEGDGGQPIGDGDECKLFYEQKEYGACKFIDVPSDVSAFLEPFQPKSL